MQKKNENVHVNSKFEVASQRDGFANKQQIVI